METGDFSEVMRLFSGGSSKLEAAELYRQCHFMLLEHEARKKYVPRVDDLTGMPLGWDGSRSAIGEQMQRLF